MLGTVAFQIAAPQFIAAFIDRAIAARPDTLSLYYLAAAFVVCTLLAEAIRLLGLHFSGHLGWTITNELRERLSIECLAVDPSPGTGRTAGEFIERIDGDVSTLSLFFSNAIFQLATGAISILGIILAVGLRDPLIAAALTVFSLCAFATLVVAKDKGVSQFADERQCRAELASFVEETVSGLDDLRGNGGDRHVLGNLDRLNARLTTAGVRAVTTIAFYNALISNAVFVTGYGLTLALSVWLHFEGSITIGTIFLMWQYAVMLRAPLELLGSQAGVLQQVAASLGRVNSLGAATPRTRNAAGLTGAVSPPTVEFREVSFSYEPGYPTLANVNFFIKAGSTLSILGKSGSGKTTVAKLACRLIEPSSGEICLSGERLGDIDEAVLRQQVFMVSQTVQILHATVRDNLTFFEPGHSDEVLVDALEKVGLGDWLRTLPGGLDASLHGDRSKLSSGEGQLLSIARIYVRKAGLLVLDEASSRLDSETEKRLHLAFDALFAGAAGPTTTTIVIAHRIDTVLRSDKILIIEDGAVIEHGTPAELLANPDSHLVRSMKSGSIELIS